MSLPEVVVAPPLTLRGSEGRRLPQQHAQLFLIMKATRLCNLRCSYCNAWREGPNQIMPLEVLQRTTKQALELPWIRRVDFVWHGGETTLLPVSYFKTAIALQEQHRGDRIVTNAIQTNATLLSEEWINLFREGRFAVGVSLDPPPERHARNRKTKSGRDSWRATMDGIQQLRQAGVAYGALVVVGAELVQYGAQRFLACLAEHDLTDVALLNVVPDNAAPAGDAEKYLQWERFVQFLADVYVERENHYRGRIRIREVDSLAENIGGGKPAVCVVAGNCMGRFLTVEPSGEISACDKYIGDRSYVFGDLSVEDLTAVLVGNKLASVWRDYGEHVAALETCPYYGYCHGGCPHDQYLIRKIRPGLVIQCCGLRPLVEVIQQRQAGETQAPH